MDLFDAEILAKQLISEYCPGVTFQWSRTKNAFGDYNAYYNRIRLSKVLTALQPESEVRRTLMHEIAHALTPYEGHGYKWRRMMIKLGQKPEVCSKTVVNIKELPGNWYGVCPAGHRSKETFMRKPRLDRSCPKCFPNKFNALYAYKWVKI